MKDIRLKKLADQLINYSVSLKKGEHLLINCTAEEIPLVKELVKSAYEIGAYPHISMTDIQVQKELLMGISEEQAEVMAVYEKQRMDLMDAYISVSTSKNPMENSGVPNENQKIMAKAHSKWSEKRHRGDIKWCVCIYPTMFYANSAGMSLDDFENYYFDVCCMDYVSFGKAMEKLKELLYETDKVRIVARDTDITFSIKGINKCVSAGERNIPDGEVYTAPVVDSVSGNILFNVPSIFNGKRFENIRLFFKKGKVVEAQANFGQDLDDILDIDFGARYVGEFAFGLNPMLDVPLGLTLFDEKIRGSIHFALGNALDLTDNGNRSSIHWDLVALHTSKMGGGKIYLDDVLVREDGEFVLEDLIALNSKNFNKGRD